MVTMEQDQWPRVMCTKGNAPGSKRQKTPSKNIIFPWLSRNSWNPIAAYANSVIFLNVAFFWRKSASAATGFQLCCENHGKMCTQIIEDTEITFWYFWRGLFLVTPRSISLGGHDLGALPLVEGHHEKSGN